MKKSLLFLMILPCMVYASGGLSDLTPIQQAITNGDVKQLRELVQAGSSLNAPDGYRDIRDFVVKAVGDIKKIRPMIDAIDNGLSSPWIRSGTPKHYFTAQSQQFPVVLPSSSTIQTVSIGSSTAPYRIFQFAKLPHLLLSAAGITGVVIALHRMFKKQTVRKDASSKETQPSWISTQYDHLKRMLTRMRSSILAR